MKWRKITVREGETLSDILRKSGASFPKLQARNAHCNLLDLRPGQRLRIPCAAFPRAYRLRKDENVYTLARKLSRSVAALLKANPHLLPSEIRRGERIALPEE